LIEFDSYESINLELKNWLFKVNSKIHSITEKIPNEELMIEKNYLHTLPETDYSLYELETRKVFTTSTISFKNKYYSVNTDYLRKKVTIKYFPAQEYFIVYHNEHFICTHHLSNKPGKYVILPEHAKQIEKLWKSNMSLFYGKKKQANLNVKPIQSEQRKLSYYEVVHQ